jgi:hypothetical protein
VRKIFRLVHPSRILRIFPCRRMFRCVVGRVFKPSRLKFLSLNKALLEGRRNKIFSEGRGGRTRLGHALGVGMLLKLKVRGLDA